MSEPASATLVLALSGDLPRGAARVAHSSFAQTLWLGADAASDGSSTGRLVAIALFLAILVVALVAAALLRRTGRDASPSVDSKAPTPLTPDEAKATLALVGDTVPLYVLRYAADGRLIAHCAGTPRLFGAALEAAKTDGRSVLPYVHPDDRATWIAAFAKRTGAAADPLELQYRLHGANGDWRWLHERLRPSRSATGELEWDAVAIDITDRRESADRQQRLLELQRLSTRLLEAFLRSDDTAATIRSTIATVGDAFGLSRASLLNVNDADGTASAAEEWRAPDMPSAADRRRSQPPEKTGWWIAAARSGQPSVFRRDGNGAGLPATALSMHAEVQAILIVPVLVHGALRAALAFEDLRLPRRFRREEIAAAQTLAFAIARAMEQRDASEERARVIELQRQLERSELVAQLAGGIAHDFNNLLFAVNGQVALVRQHVVDDETLAALDRIEQALEGASGMVAGILRAHRGVLDPPTPRQLRADLQDGVRLASRLLPRTIELDADLSALGDVTVRSSEGRLGQLVLNLALNARDALGERGHLRLAGRLRTDPRLGPSAHITFEDDGPGIPPEMRQRVLAPYFTTKGAAAVGGGRSGGGTGLGLSICQRVVEEAGGTLSLDASPALGGLRVTAILPVVDGAATLGGADATTEVKDDGTRSAGGAPDVALDDVRLVLVVEDDDAVRRILTNTFAEREVDVVERSDASEVESIVTDSPLHFDLLVMDVDLPGVSGMDCVRRLRARGCTVPVVFVTGGTTELDPNLAPARLLRKPFPIEALASTARELLDTSRDLPSKA